MSFSHSSWFKRGGFSKPASFTDTMIPEMVYNRAVTKKLYLIGYKI
jgi:hypothetical protein